MRRTYRYFFTVTFLKFSSCLSDVGNERTDDRGYVEWRKEHDQTIVEGEVDRRRGKERRSKISIIYSTFKDEKLRQAVLLHKGKNWKKIAEHLEGREDTQCLHRWQKVLNPALVKGPWTKEVCFLVNYTVLFNFSTGR